MSIRFGDAYFVPDVGYIDKPKEFGIRASSSGIATIHGRIMARDALPYGRVAHRLTSLQDIRTDVKDIVSMVDGTERWSIDYMPGVNLSNCDITFLSGQFHIMEFDHKFYLKCDCGWRGKSRAWVARNNMMGDATQRHGRKCSIVDRQLAKAEIKP